MKIKFEHSKLVEGLIKLSIDGGESFREYRIEDVKDTGIPLSDTQDLGKIKIIAPANILRNLNVVSGIQVEATLGKADQSVDGNIEATGAVISNSATIGTLNANTARLDAVTSETVTASTLEVTEGTVANLNVTELNGDAVQSTYHVFGKSENYIDIAQPSSDTGSIIIKIPNVSAGTYRLHYMDDQTKEVYFSCTINNTFDNGYFSYYKGEPSACLEQVGVKGNDFYFKTGKAGRLYYTSDTLDNLDAPTTYEDWPVNVEQDLDFPLFNATRRKATVYTNFINVDMNDNTFGTAILDLYTGNEYGRMGTQGGSIQYDPNANKTFYVYYPDQNLNKTEAVSFHELTVTGDEENVHIVDGNVSLKTIKIRGMGDDQYLIKRSSSENLVAEAPVDNPNDGTALSRTGNHLITERTVANWDGSTDRTGDGTFTSSISHVNKIVEGEWDAGDIKTTKLTVNGDATVTGKTVSQGNLEVEGDASIGGNLTVSGKVISVDTETITTEENSIELRHDASIGLIPGDISGVIINNYDGNGSDAQIALDNTGTLRIGDIGDTEPVATRAESTDLTNDNLLKWDADGNRLVDSGKSLDDIADDIEAAKNSISEINGWSEYLERINPASAPTNITQIATQIQNYMTTLDYDCIVFKALMTVAQCSTYLGLTFNDPKILVYTCDKSSGTTINAATLSAIDNYLYFSRYDFTNNVWTPANRINDLNLMSTGVNTQDGTSYGALKVGPETAPHIEMGLDPDDNTMMRIYSKAPNNSATGAPLKISGEYVWVPNVLRIPIKPPANLQPGMIWVSI